MWFSMKLQKYINDIKNTSVSSRTTESVSTKNDRKYPCVKRIRVFTKKDYLLFQKGDYYVLLIRET